MRNVDSNARITEHGDPVAIAMWDFSWLLRHEPGHEVGSEFSVWDRVLDELVERGYNAIRLDVFPHLVAKTSKGEVIDRFKFSGGKRPVMWGAQHDTWVDPRQALREFIPKCLQRGILLGLSTWFSGPGDIQGEDEFVRVWDETLSLVGLEMQLPPPTSFSRRVRQQTQPKPFPLFWEKAQTIPALMAGWCAR